MRMRPAASWPGALPLFEATWAKMSAKLGSDHPETLMSINNLASAYLAGGEFAKAFTALRGNSHGAKKKAKLGPDHPDTLTSMNNSSPVRGKTLGSWPRRCRFSRTRWRS